MKRIVIAAAAAFALLGGAQAQTTSQLYGELGYTFFKLSGDGESFRNGAVRAILGYEAHPNFAIEGVAGFATDDDETTIVDPVLGPATVAVKVQNSYGIFLKPKYAFNNQLEVFGRLGWARTKVKASASVVGLSFSGSESENDLAYGAGVNFSFNPRTYVGLDYIRYYSKDGTKVDGATLSVGYRF